jgi:signal transduction histidine kinase
MYIIAGVLIVFYSYKAENILKSPPVTPGYRIINENTYWIKRVIISLRIFSILFTTIVLIDFLFFDYAFSFFGDPIFVIMAIITYWLGLEGFARRNNLAFKKVEILSKKDQTQLQEIADKITSVMDHEKLYRNQDLTVSSLSEAIQVKSYLVTKTLTTIFNKKFNDYIN